jgi:hypothetical protein
VAVKKQPLTDVMLTAEVCAYLNLSKQRVNQLFAAGRLIGRKAEHGTGTIFLRESVEAFAKIERTNQPLK